MTINIKQKNVKDFFSTFDLALATAVSIHFPISSIDRTLDSRKALFVFRRSSKLDQIVDRYWQRGLLIEPRQYFDQLKVLKERLYSSN